MVPPPSSIPPPTEESSSSSSSSDSESDREARQRREAGHVDLAPSLQLEPKALPEESRPGLGNYDKSFIGRAAVPPRRYTCDDCGQVFAKKSALDEHTVRARRLAG